MNKTKTVVLLLLMSILNIENSLADISYRGRYSDFSDNSGGIKDLFMPIYCIIAIVIGGFFFSIYITDKNKDKTTKEWGCWGCVSLIVGIGALILLIIRGCTN